MGKKRIAVIGETPQATEKTDHPRPIVKSGKGTGRLTDMNTLAPAPPVPSVTPMPSVTKKPIQKKVRSRKYRLALTHVDRTKSYPLEEAVKLLKKISIARYDASVEAHLNITDVGIHENVTFPHATGRKTRVAIATDSLLKDVAAGKIDFDVLIASPEMMTKIAKVAKILGPKGLMPNPKAGTITQDPEKKKQALEGGQILVKTEPKAPLMHVVVGKLSMPSQDLSSNIQTLISAIGTQKILKLTLASSISPGIKVDLQSPQE
ncbi:MAG: hypothetical protein HY381_00445 [Candidatus Chisholmbacteria bacterium]|nr:hypothetical protein [Candidatus Chisholmbacteria bacterium]